MGAQRRGILTALYLSPDQRKWKCIEDAARADARHRLANLALAVTAYKLKNNKYPAKLDDLVPAHISAVPVDPFDGKPLRMTVADGGPVLYSVGPDGKDDGGAELDKSEGKTGDITFCLGPAWQIRRAKSKR